MKKRPFSAPLLCALLGAPAVAALAPGALAQNAAPQSAPATAYVLAVRGDMITLSAGSNNGARAGAVYQIARDNKVVRLQLVEVLPAQSQARIVAVETGGQSLVITVGDAATLVGIAAEETPATPETPETPEVPVTALPPEQPSVEATPDNSDAPPAQVLVTSVSGSDIMLGAGTNRNMKLGAVYVMPASGTAQARMIVVEVTGDSARARLLSVEEGFVPVVGELARFESIEPIPADLVAPPTPVEVTPTQPTIIVPNAGNGAPSATLTTAGTTEISGRAASVIAVNGANVTLGAGTLQGAKAGQNVPILRGGAVIGLVRIESAGSDTSLATIVYSDAAQGAISVGNATGA